MPHHIATDSVLCKHEASDFVHTQLHCLPQYVQHTNTRHPIAKDSLPCKHEAIDSCIQSCIALHSTCHAHTTLRQTVCCASTKPDASCMHSCVACHSPCDKQKHMHPSCIHEHPYASTVRLLNIKIVCGIIPVLPAMHESTCIIPVPSSVGAFGGRGSRSLGSLACVLCMVCVPCLICFLCLLAWLLA